MSIIGQKKRSTPDPYDINGSIVHLLHRAGQCTGEVFAARLGHLDLTPRQFAVMIAVGARESSTQISITEDTGIDRSTMVDVVRRLMKRGLLQRRRSRADARFYVVRLTPAGRELIDGAVPEAVKVENAILSGLSPRDRDTLVKSLTVVIGQLEAASQASRGGSVVLGAAKG